MIQLLFFLFCQLLSLCRWPPSSFLWNILLDFARFLILKTPFTVAPFALDADIGDVVAGGDRDPCVGYQSKKLISENKISLI